MSVPTTYSLPRIIVVMLACIFYGAYVVLFSLAMWILPRKFHIPSVKNFIFPAIIVLFTLGTINIGYDLVGEVYAILYTIPADEKPWMIVGQSLDIITYMLADILGDLILFYRVYAVWGFQKIVLIPLLLILLSAKLFGILQSAAQIYVISGHSTGIFSVTNGHHSFWFFFLVLNPIVNVSMTLLIAGRVWWITRTLRIEFPVLSQLSQSDWGSRTLAVIIESGIIYPVYLVLEAVLGFSNGTSLAINIIGLAPTLIAVRVGLGSTIDDASLRSTILRSTLAFTTRPRSASALVLDIGTAREIEDIRPMQSSNFSRQDIEKGIHGTYLGCKKSVADAAAYL